MAEADTGGKNPSVGAVLAIVLLALIGVLVLRGALHRAGEGQDAKSNIQIHIPQPTAPGK